MTSDIIPDVVCVVITIMVVLIFVFNLEKITLSALAEWVTAIGTITMAIILYKINKELIEKQG